LFPLILLLIFSQESPDPLMAQHKYLTKAIQLQAEVHKLEDPAILRNYIELITEKYSSQIGFRTFFLKDLSDGEKLAALRRHTEEITLNANGDIVERNLESLLLSAQRKFPDSLDVRFSIGIYLFRGRCCQTTPKILVNPREIIATFAEADAAGMHTAGSLLALALNAISNKEHVKARGYLQRGLALSPDDPDLNLGQMNALLSASEWDNGIKQARKLFEVAFDPELRVDALLGAARGLFAKKDYQESAKTALSSLKIIPNHMFALHIGLDGLRASGVAESYREAVINFLAQQPDNPELFQIYMEYLRIRGATENDRLLMKTYSAEREEDPLVRITRLVNQSSFLRMEKQTPKALSLLEQARKQAGEMKDTPPDLIPILDQLLDTAKKNLN